MTEMLTALTGIVTTDLAAITRGRFFPAEKLEAMSASGIGWVPANLSITAFGTIASPNPWGSSGDLRIIPDLAARYRSSATGAATPFDIVIGDIVELDGKPWRCCPRTVLKEAVAAFESETGLRLSMAIEQEFHLLDAGLPAAHPMSVAALRRADAFASRLAAALSEAGVEPEVLIAEFGEDQFEVTCAPSDPVTAADRAVAIREITREIARLSGWRASFAPKNRLHAAGNGVHIHFSLVDAQGAPVMYDPEAPGRLSATGASFCAGLLRHMRALLLLTAPTIPSYYRLRPNSWSASWTWLGDRDREASLRICPVTTIGGSDPARQFNIEFRAADATANPYLALAVLIRAGLAGLSEGLPRPPIVAEHPDRLDEEDRRRLGLQRLPTSLDEAVAAWQADPIAGDWLAPELLQSLAGIRAAAAERLAGLDAESVCQTYAALY